ncbi:alpha-beta hydrolase superfamily lysophospholipase [Litorivivens lipolytica]|uniref:Alpha-beta hydrolase superfamily lysophospholipase n=1 Tax=Litorivivens lipolytica TaxID=1524264 RepID=A0A7W4W4K3_9GAMM|nr:alpha/beta hydrolase [Litorivivens lipolytica]MBB3047346.1 alpha-beta hydrolase superfamily lysophospholipase [Litorivivens lipolytica]
MSDWVSLAVSNRDTLNLPRLAAAEDSTPLADAYFQFYGIDFENRYEGLKHHFGVFDSAGFEIAAHVFIPPQAKKTAWLYHGFYDHAGLFKHAIDYCLQRNWAVVVYDLPGHGLSTGKPAEIDSFDQYLQVLRDAFAAAACFDLPATRIAMAQSTGGAILMTYLLQGGEAFEHAVLLAPLVRPKGWRLGKPLHHLIGRRIASLPRRWAENSGDAEFCAWLREADALQCGVLPMSWVNALKHWERAFHRLPTSPVSVLVVQGDADATVDWRFNLPVIRKHFPEARICQLEGARHHLVNESEGIREQIWAQVDEYLMPDQLSS